VVKIGGEWNDGSLPQIRGGKWALVNKNGKEIIDLKYDYIPAIDDGYFEIKIKI
jgi:hypothetical protein